MNLTVIISTYNGAKKLPVILDSLTKQSYKDFELLIVVDGSIDETMDVLQEWTNRFYDFKIIYQQNKGRAAVRNTGVKNAKGELLLFFDDDLKLHHSAEEWERVGQVSLCFENFSTWKGKGRLNTKDKKLLKRLIDSVHLAGKPIRFWAAPDNKTSWKIQMKVGADLIGTDKINELAGFLRKQNKNRLNKY